MDLKGLQKQEQAPPKGTRKEVLKIAAEISAMEDKGMTLEQTGEFFFL